MRIDINFDTLLKTQVFISGFDRRLQDFSRFWTDFIGPFTFDTTDDIFETGGYGRWASLDPMYAARKAITYPGKGILRREDTYYEAATNPNHPESLMEVSALELVLGVRSDYAAFHEEETEHRSARPVYAYIAAGEQFEERVRQLGEKYQREEIAILERSLR